MYFDLWEDFGRLLLKVAAGLVAIAFALGFCAHWLLA